MNIRKLIITMVAAIGLLAALGATTASAVPSLQASDHQVARADGTQARAASTSANLMDSGNNGAWVSGVGYCGSINQNADCWTWVNTSTGTPCPSGHFCIYTNVWASEGGKVFSFYHCKNSGRDWALQNWNGVGLFNNNNDGGARAYIKGSSHNVLKTTSPGDRGSYDFRPAWYVQAC